ncbi:hypothetical protein B9Z19DRAFT_1077184 [Tuber borchii]|uniref:Uncharacterized protein n=1 Tax=Tuber borchii TaxID=42251 RepID=A0A2T7A110_TUBBO|nr:hypothetical protein B9Z19DRAFT_1077184 [Tuber borchii]
MSDKNYFFYSLIMLSCPLLLSREVSPFYPLILKAFSHRQYISPRQPHLFKYDNLLSRFASLANTKDVRYSTIHTRTYLGR